MNPIRNLSKRFILWWYNRKFKSCGSNFKWNPLSSVFVKPECAEIGNNVFLGEGFHISVHDSLKIGDGVIVGPRLIIMGGDHDFNRAGEMLYQQKEGINLPVTIEKDVWIGARVTILKGVTVGEGSVIGAESLVTADIPKYAIAIGSPAKPVKKRFSDEELTNHLKKLDYDGEDIDQIIKARNKYFEENK